MIIWPPKGLAGSTSSQAVLNDFFNRNPSLANLPIPLNVRGHPSRVGYHIIVSPTVSLNIVTFITQQTNFKVAIGPFREVDGDGFQNWISFSKELRTSNPRTVTKICLLCLLQLHNLIAWP